MNNNEQTASTPEVSEDAYEQSIASALDAFNSNTADDAPEVENTEDTAEAAEGEEQAVESADDAEPEGEAEVEADDADADADPEGDADAEPAAEEQQPDDSAPTLPAAHVRSLKAYGWSDEDIAAASGTSAFAETAARIHASRVEQTKEWANQGRAHKEAQPDQSGPAQSAKPADIPRRLDADALKDKYGDSELVDDIVNAFNPLLDQIHSALPSLEQGRMAAEQAQLAAARAQVDAFFNAEDMKPYASHYGLSCDDMTEDQQANRIKLLQTADDIRTGATLRGQDLPITQAMSMAHDIVGANFKASAVRQEIRKQMTDRSKGRTLKPGTQAARKPSATASNEQEIERNARERLAALGKR